MADGIDGGGGELLRTQTVKRQMHTVSGFISVSRIVGIEGCPRPAQTPLFPCPHELAWEKQCHKGGDPPALAPGCVASPDKPVHRLETLTRGDGVAGLRYLMLSYKLQGGSALLS